MLNNPPRHPMYNLGTPPKPVEPKREELEPPSESRLRTLLAVDCADEARILIEKFNMPFEIVNGTLKDKLKGTDLWLKRFITIDPDTVILKDEITTLSKHTDEVLIIGETGTGKELLSRALIGNREGNSLAINCAGLPENLIESELFGHARGSFTGAESEKKGMMESAGDGLLFLDEIGELPLQAQGKLLRAIQDRTIRKVGSNKEIEINCRFVFATNKNIREMVSKGTFRQDLYARISTFELHVKPLRQRKCDLEPICNSIQNGTEFYKKHGDKLHNGTLSLEHNVRSIQQHIRRYTVIGRVVLSVG